MTSEIEKTRQELEENVKKALIKGVKNKIDSCNKDDLYHKYLIDFGTAQGFNLGVELAQKEFIDFLHDLRLKNVFEDKFENEKMLINKINTLKQSIEGEK